MVDNIIIRSYQLGDEEQIIQLLDLVFKGWPHYDIPCPSIDHWIWKFKENPTRKYNIAVAESEKKIVACDHGFYINIKLGQNTLLSRQGVDSAVHPSYRGRGIWTKTDKLKTETDLLNNVSLVYSVSTNPIFIKRNVRKRKDLSHLPSPVTRLIRIKDVDRLLQNRPQMNSSRKIWLKSTINAAKLVNHIHNLLRTKMPTSTTYKISDVEKFDERMNIFWGKVKEDYNFIAERTAEYVNWRYRDPRGGVYVVKQAEENGEIIGYIVLRVASHTRDSDETSGYIVDLCTLRNRLDCAASLVAEASDFFDNKGVNEVEYWINKGHPYEALFNHFDFLNERNDVNVPLSPPQRFPELEDVENSKPHEILFQLGDTDWI